MEIATPFDLGPLYLQQYSVSFVYTRDATRYFNHSTFVLGHLCSIFGHPLPNLQTKPLSQWILIPNVVESGRISYSSGDEYAVGLTVIGRNAPSQEQLHALFAANSPPSSALRFKTLLPVQLTNIGRQVEAIATLNRITLHFVSPLLIEQKIPDSGSRIFDRQYFEPDHFHKTLYGRFFDLAKLCTPSERVFKALPFPKARVLTNSLDWINIPARDNDVRTPQYSGALGKVTLEGDCAGWHEAVVIGQYIHLGKRTNLGFGRYEIERLI